MWARIAHVEDDALTLMEGVEQRPLFGRELADSSLPSSLPASGGIRLPVSSGFLHLLYDLLYDARALSRIMRPRSLLQMPHELGAQAPTFRLHNFAGSGYLFQGSADAQMRGIARFCPHLVAVFVEPHKLLCRAYRYLDGLLQPGQPFPMRAEGLRLGELLSGPDALLDGLPEARHKCAGLRVYLLGQRL